MKNIFCLETEWVQTIHDLKQNSSVSSLLKFIETSSKVDKTYDVTQYAFRQVATKSDFEYYLFHLLRDSYAKYEIIYLCFHGNPGEICFANGGSIGLDEMIEDERYKGIFDGKNVHFGSCCTMLEFDSLIKKFKRHTGAKTITGYETKVSFTQSFIFELWLMESFRRHPNYRAKQIANLAEKEMPFFANQLNFVSY